jgi:hypothetical protein
MYVFHHGGFYKSYKCYMWSRSCTCKVEKMLPGIVPHVLQCTQVLPLLAFSFYCTVGCTRISRNPLSNCHCHYLFTQSRGDCQIFTHTILHRSTCLYLRKYSQVQPPITTQPHSRPLSAPAATATATATATTL